MASSSINARSMEGWKEKSKSLRRFCQGSPEKCRLVSIPALAAGSDLRFQQLAQEVGVTPVLGGGLLGERGVVKGWRGGPGKTR